MIALDILSDGFFAAIAGIGFGAISDPPLRAFKMIAILAAAGHACRYCLDDFPRCRHCHGFFVRGIGYRLWQFVARAEGVLSDDCALYTGIAPDDSG